MGRQAHHISDSQKVLTRRHDRTCQPAPPVDVQETLTQTVNNLCVGLADILAWGSKLARGKLHTAKWRSAHVQDQLKAEIAAIVKAEAADKNRQPFPTEVDSRLKSDATKALFKRLPRFVQMSMIRNRDSSGLPVLPKDLEAERILGRFVQQELRNQPPVKKVKATFAPRFHAMDLMTSSPLPSAFDCAFGYALGHTAALLVNERRNFYVACCAGMHRNTRYWEPCAIPFTYLYPETPHVPAMATPGIALLKNADGYDDVAAFTKSGSPGEAISGCGLGRSERKFGRGRGGVELAEVVAAGCNVVCFVPNGPKVVKMVDRWTECRWRGYKLFVKARHVQPAPAGASLDTATRQMIAL
ncbi:pfp [Symbiodinium sp. CCMP2592]|nr:pfp [Symbiodinium sp. CCMP2592]